VLVLLLQYRIIPYYDMSPEEIADINYGLLYYYIFMHFFAFYSTALMIIYLSERLKRTRTALEEMDEDLSDLRLLHQRIIDHMTAGLLITSLEGQINFINEPGVRILALPVEGLLGKQIGTLFIEQIDMPRVIQTLKTTKLVSIERSLIQEKKATLIVLIIYYMHANTSC